MRRYQRKLLDDGTPNPKYKPDTRRAGQGGKRSGRSGHSGKSGRSGVKLSKFDRGEFVAWDGEGANVRARHEYILLASSAGAQLAAAQGLRTVDSLAQLAAGMAASPLAIHVGFAISYDVNMVLRDIPKRALRELWEGERTTWYAQGRYFRLEYRPRKYLKVRTALRAMGPWAGGTLWDAWPFFQSSFVAACRKYKIGTVSELEALEKGKRARSTFRARDLPDIIRYNALELRLLVQLMRALWESLTRAQLRVSRWDGPGAVAAALLTREGVNDRPTHPPPELVLDASQFAYYGGRVECVQYGDRQGPVHQYDLNSAYPAAMRSVPCRATGCGHWQRWSNPGAAEWSLASFAVHHVRWSFPRGSVVYPFPWRSARGGVYFPREGEGWVWTPELLAARDQDLARSLTVLESWEWVEGSCGHLPPYAWIARVYQERERARALGDGAEHALKLSLNSIYGKTAQRAGAQYTQGEGWRLPPFHDLAAAGWVTSTVRAQLYAAACERPSAVVMLATDAIYTTRKLTQLQVDAPGDKTLGAWTHAAHIGATVVQSGVYWLQGPDGARALYSRGFARESLDHAAVLQAWTDGAPHYVARQRRFVGLGLALAGREGTVASRAAWARWRRWIDEPRELTLHPWTTKRVPQLAHDRRPADPARGLVATLPADTTRLWGDTIGGRGAMTTPSGVPWRPLPGAPVEAEADVVSRADAESQDATL